MVFSFFKKDPKDPKKPAARTASTPATTPRTGNGTTVQTRPTPKPIGKPLSGPVNRSLNRPTSPVTAFPTTETAIPDRDRQRTRALETAAKIDQIESEMARDLMRGLGRSTGTGAGLPAKPAVAAGGATRTRTAGAPPAAKPPAEEADAATDVLHGDIDAIEINTSGAGSIIDETAILFSNGQIDEAESVLRAGLRGGDLGPSTPLAWHMLFELVNQRGDKAGYEKLTMDYAMRFERPAPAWHEYIEPTPPARRGPAAAPPASVATPVTGGPPCVRLGPRADGGIVKELEQLRSLTATHAAVQLDLSHVQAVDFIAADLLLRVLNAFKKSNREITLLGAERFEAMLQKAVESGRRDPSDAIWMLLLEVQRLLGRQAEFEETAIQYCVTFELSPPSWEPPPANLKIGAATEAPVIAAPAPAAAPAVDALELRGVVEGEGEPHFSRLLTAAKDKKTAVIDCRHLRRMAFSAGSAFLVVVRRLQQQGAEVQLRDVNPLIAALMHLLGITTIVNVQPRRG